MTRTTTMTLAEQFEVTRSIGTASPKDVLTLSIAEWDALPEAEQAYLASCAKSTTGLLDREALKRQLLTHIYISGLNGEPIKLGEANQLFARVAKKLGATTGELLFELVKAGLVCEIAQANVAVFITRENLDYVRTHVAADEADFRSIKTHWLMLARERSRRGAV